MQTASEESLVDGGLSPDVEAPPPEPPTLVVER